MAATVTQILDDLSDYSDFEEVGSVARAKTFITACRRFLALPASQSDQGSSLGYTPQLIANELEFARRYVAANDTSSSAASSVRFLSASEGFRR